MQKKIKYTLISIILLMSIGLFVLNEDIIEETPSEEFIYNLESSNIFISTDTTWNLTGSPYYINEDYTIEAGATLTIEPGVQILFNGLYSIIIDGALNATGTKENPILFSSNLTLPQIGDWGSIYFRKSLLASKSIMEHANISYAENGIRIDESTVKILNSTISKCQKGIKLEQLPYSGDIIIENNSIFNNSEQGINMWGQTLGNVNVEIINNKIYRNGFSGVILFTEGDYLKLNLWGNTVFNNTGSGINFNWCDKISSLIFEENEIYNNSEDGVVLHYLYASDTVSFQFNDIYNNNDNGVDMDHLGEVDKWIPDFYFQYNRVFNNSNDGVYLDTNSVDQFYFRYNQINNNSNYGVSITSTGSYGILNLIFQNNEISNNSNGLYINDWGINTYMLKHNNIKNNSNYAIECRWEEPSEIINMASNWWGTNNTNQIDSMVYDYYDNILYAKVNYSAFLNHSVIETYNAEPPQWSNLQINDTSIYLGDQVNISIEVSDNINVSKVWIEIDNNIYNMINVSDSNTYCFIFTPSELKKYSFTIYMNDTSGILNITTGVISILQINDNNEIPADEDENDLVVILLMTTILLSIVGVPSIYVITSKKKEKEGVKLKQKLKYDKLPQKIKEVSYMLYLEKKAQEKRDRLIKKGMKPEVSKKEDLDLQEIKIVSIFEGKNAIETISDLGDVNITALSKEYLEKIEKFEWDENEKEVFLEEMLALPPEKRDVILEHMIEKSKSKNLKE